MGFTLEKVLTFYIIPITMVIAILLVLPLPRIIKKVGFLVTELKIPQLSQIKLGYLYCGIMLIMTVLKLTSYLNNVNQLNSETADTMIMEKDCTDLRFCNVTANLVNKSFRDCLLYGFGFLVSIMNFVLTNKQRTVYSLEDEVASAKKNN